MVQSVLVANVLARLTRLRDLRKKQGHVHKARAYERVVYNIKKLCEARKCSAEDILNVEGVGESIRKKILNVLRNVSLGKWKDGNEIASEEISREEMKMHARALSSLLKPRRVIVVGSFRRGEKTSGDIDVLVVEEKNRDKGKSTIKGTRTNARDVVDILQYSGYWRDTISKGSKFASGLVGLPGLYGTRKIDVFTSTHDRLPFALLHLTGDKYFNIHVRLHAKRLGYLLNDTGLFRVRNGKREPVENIAFTSERDIFDFLGLKYVTPMNRNGRSAVIVSLPRKLQK